MTFSRAHWQTLVVRLAVLDQISKTDEGSKEIALLADFFTTLDGLLNEKHRSLIARRARDLLGVVDSEKIRYELGSVAVTLLRVATGQLNTKMATARLRHQWTRIHHAVQVSTRLRRPSLLPHLLTRLIRSAITALPELSAYAEAGERG